MKHISKTNTGFKICIILIILSILITVVVFCILKYSYNQLNFVTLSNTIEYRKNVKIINNEEYLENNNLKDSNKPRLEYNDGIVTLLKNGHDDAYITFVYTGDVEFNYFGYYMWDDLMKVGRKYLDINVNNGFNRSYDGFLELEENGWYTIFAMWNEDGHKEYYVENFNVVCEATKKETYNQWRNNKELKKSIDGVTNYLIVGANGLTKIGSDVSNTVTLMSINNTTKEIVFTWFLKEMYVYIPDIGCSRLVDVFNYGGIELLVKTIEENFGIKIDNYVMYDYSVFAEFIDSFGGMSVSLKSEQIEYMNRYITSYYEDHGLGGVERERISEDSIGDVKLNGVKTLAYLSFLDTGVSDRSQRYTEVYANIKNNLKNINFIYAIQNILPRITTDISFGEFLWLVSSHFDFINSYKYPFQKLPYESSIADFCVGYQNIVVLSNQDESTMVLNNAFKQGDFSPAKQNLLIWIFIGLAVFDFVIILFALYLAFIKKYKIIYICENGQIPIGQKKEYRFMKNAHVYHQHFVPEGYKGMYADKKMTYEFTNEFKMPMRNIKVYVKSEK